jgi:hypothetical protein
MDERYEVLDECTPLLPTGVPKGSDEALRSIGYGRQTGQVQQRIGDEDQRPMVPMASALRMRYALKPTGP